jgi:putative DNA primase/helicase
LRAEPYDDFISPATDGECKDIVRYVAPARPDPEPTDDGAEDAHRHVVRPIQGCKLALEMMDLSEDLPVRHGKSNHDHAVFVQIESEGSSNWVSTDDDRLKRFLRAQAYKRLGRGPSKGVVDDVVAHIEARGFALPTEPMSRRVHWDGECIWVCLGPGSQRSVRISKDGWSLTDSPPVIFRPASNAETLPEPTRGGRIDSLKQFFNIGDDCWPGLVGFLIANYLPQGGFPVLCVIGPESSGKSLTTEMIRWLTDPVVGLDARVSLPESEEDLFTIASNTHVLSLENVSKISNELSDGLCKVTTGGAYMSRKLYAQGSTHILRCRSPVIVNGITALPQRPDLLSRCVVLELLALPEACRRVEGSIRREFHRELPAALGAIFDALVVAIRDDESTVVEPLPRLADAARFVTAAEPALGMPDGSIVASWSAALAGAQMDLCSSDPVADVLARIFKRDSITTWKGTATDLAKAALKLEKDGQELPKDFPREAKRLGDHCGRRSSVMKRAGFMVQRVRTASARLLEITKQPPEPLLPVITVKRPGHGSGEGGGT